jgi:hypothetical protein
MGLEMVRCLQRFSNDSVVVDFAIDSKSNTVILVGKRLSSTVNTNNTQTFVGKNLEVLVIASDAISIAASYLCCWPCNFPTNLGHDACIASPFSKP